MSVTCDSGFLLILRFPPPIKLTATKVALNTINQTLSLHIIFLAFTMEHWHFYLFPIQINKYSETKYAYSIFCVFEHLLKQIDWIIWISIIYLRRFSVLFIKCSYMSNSWSRPGLTLLEGDSSEEVALWLLTSLCTSAKREIEVAL